MLFTSLEDIPTYTMLALKIKQYKHMQSLLIFNTAFKIAVSQTYLTSKTTSKKFRYIDFF